MKGLWSNEIDPTWHPSQIFDRNDHKWYPSQNNPEWIGNYYNERDATSIENRFRKAVGQQPRKFYPGPAFDPRTPGIPNSDGNHFFIYRYPAGVELFLKTQTTYE